MNDKSRNDRRTGCRKWIGSIQPVRPAIDLATIPEEELLGLRLSELPVRIEGTWLEACIAQLYDELKARNIPFEPRCYLADEWLTPENEPVIGVPFYLAHPRLIKLQKKMLLEAEGDTYEWCMKLLRHEAGHALTYAYGLNRKTQLSSAWFGRPVRKGAGTGKRIVFSSGTARASYATSITTMRSTTRMRISSRLSPCG